MKFFVLYHEVVCSKLESLGVVGENCKVRMRLTVLCSGYGLG